MIRILFVVKDMRLSNGVASYTLNYFRQLNGSEIHFDFLVVTDVGSTYYQEIKQSGSKVFILPSYTKHPIKMISYLRSLFSKEQYDIIHCNVLNSGSIILREARKQNIPVRILHSHATQTGDEKWKELRNIIFSKISLRNANCYFSCSQLAGDYLFGQNNYYLIPNAIDIEKFSFNESIRHEIQKKENCENKLVLMTVGRITRQKNPEFIVDLVKSLKNIREDFILWWFGNGELEESIKKRAKEKNVLDKIKFWGASNRVNEYYSAADIFILPSLYEGLPVAGIEAQVSGLSVIFSEKITAEAQITPNVIYLPITDPNIWATNISKHTDFDRNTALNNVNLDAYKIEVQSQKLKNLYLDLLSNKENLSKMSTKEKRIY